MEKSLFVHEEILLRSEEPGDYRQVETLLSSAFGGQDEVQLVDRIRKTGEYINDLTLVAVRDDCLVGYIMLSAVRLQGKDESYNVLALAPVAVLPAFQKMGIGSLLIREGIRLAERNHEALIVLLGHAGYYPRFGFVRASKQGICPPLSWPDDSYMVYLLSHYRAKMKGKIVYGPVWQIG